VFSGNLGAGSGRDMRLGNLLPGQMRGRAIRGDVAFCGSARGRQEKFKGVGVCGPCLIHIASAQDQTRDALSLSINLRRLAGNAKHSAPEADRSKPTGSFASVMSAR
jgi:hypothetical protein